jgi:hypothetical protein
MVFAKNLIFALLLAGTALSQTACSNSNWVKNVDLGTAERNGEEFIEVSTTLNVQGLSVVSFAAPIFDPKNPSHMIGEISFENGIVAGTAQLSVLISRDVIPNLPAMGNGTLPNGTTIPVAGVNPSKWMSIAINSKSRLYLNIDFTTKTFVFGTALNIDALTTGTVATVLMPYNVNNFSGAAGAYSGAAAGQSGLAFFVNASNLMTSFPLLPSSTTEKISKSETAVEFFAAGTPEDGSRLQRRIKQLKEARTKLRVK